MTQMVKRLSTIWETWVRSLGWEDPLEKEMAIYSSTIAWKIPWTEEPGRLQSMGFSQEFSGFIFAFGCGVSLFGGIQHSPMVVQQRVIILEFSQEKMSTLPSTLPSCPPSLFK